MRDPAELIKKLLERVNSFSKNKSPLLKKEHRVIRGPVEVLSDLDGFQSAERFFVLDEEVKDWIEMDFTSLPSEERPESGDIIQAEGFFRTGNFFNCDWDRLLVLEYEVVQKRLNNQSTTP